MAGHQTAWKREVFTISRELEYFTADELEKQTGYTPAEWWPAVITKELFDNALDAAEAAGVAPEITARWSGSSLVVQDNGGGIPPEIVRQLMDYSTRTSDKLAYVSPTRGAQGNAWKTILAMPYVLDGEYAQPIVIEAQGIRHQIHVGADQIARQPAIHYQAEELAVKNGGTTVSLERLQASLEAEDETPGFLPRLVSDFSLFNPHASFQLHTGTGQMAFPARDPAWLKWSPRDPTSAHWYTRARFEELVASYVAAGHNLFVRDFLAQFRGLTGTQARMQVLDAAEFARGMKLEELADRARGRFDQNALYRLLLAMQQTSKPVPPEKLGVLGKEHFLACLPGGDSTFRYARETGTDTRGLPYVVEAASRVTEDELLRGLHVGLNSSVPLTNPLQDSYLPLTEGGTRGLEGLLRHQRIDVHRDPLALVLHIATPRFEFLDRGKGSAELDRMLARAVSGVVNRVIKEFAAIKRSLDREQHLAARRLNEQYRRGRVQEISGKQAAWQVMREAYLKASGGGQLPANARQVMYAARPAILKITGREFQSDTFTQGWLPEYQREHPEETAAWDVVYDDRGHLIEPHTQRVIGLGTLNVREYLRQAEISATLPPLKLPDFVFRFPTHGPRHRYASVLFIEKEGFLPLFERARIADRYDTAVMSTKGMGTAAGRRLIESLARGGVRIFVLRDFDDSGFLIAGILRRDTTRYQYDHAPEVVDLGLRLADVREYELQSEPVIYKKADPTARLRKNGATDEEIRFLVRGPNPGGGWQGQRVELNAFTSDQFVEWLEAKLESNKVSKVIPDARMLEHSYRRVLELHELERQLRRAMPDAQRAARTAAVPADLRARIARTLADDPATSWDEALYRLTAREKPTQPQPQK
jgi:hypothetical protein